MCDFLEHLALFCPCMAPLAYLCTRIDNASYKGCKNIRCFRSNTAIIMMLRYISLLFIHFLVNASIYHISIEEDCMSNVTSGLTQLSYVDFLPHFCLHYPHPTPLCLLPLLYKYNRQINLKLHGKKYPNFFLPRYI